MEVILEKKQLIIVAFNIGSFGTIMQLKGFISTAINLNCFSSIKVILKKQTYNKILEDRKFDYKTHNVNFYQTKTFFLDFFKFNSYDRKKVIFVPGAIGFYLGLSNLLMFQSNLPFDDANCSRLGFLFSFKLKIAKYLTTFSIIFARQLVFNTKFSKLLVKSSLPKFTHKKLDKARVIPLGLGLTWLNEIKKKAMQKPLDIFSIGEKDEITIVYPSSFDLYKHHEFVIDTAIEFSKMFNKTIKLIFIGGNKSSRTLELKNYLFSKAIKTVKLQIFQDVKHSDILKLFLKCDIGIFMSSCESFGYSLLELVSSGLPVICNNYPAFKEIYGNNIYYSNLSNPKKTAIAIKKMIETPKITSQKVFIAQQIALALTSEKSDKLLIKELRSLT